MLTVNFRLSTTLNKTEIQAYDLLAMLGDIGGLNDFFLLILAPLVAYIVGDRFQYIMLRSMYMQNRRKEGEGDDFDAIDNERAMNDEEKKKVKES